MWNKIFTVCHLTNIDTKQKTGEFTLQVLHSICSGLSLTLGVDRKLDLINRLTFVFMIKTIKSIPL